MSEDFNDRKNRGRKEESPSRYSPDRFNSSLEEYQIRNRQYEEKVRELLSELKDIKQDIKQTKAVDRQQEETSLRLKEDLKLKLE